MLSVKVPNLIMAREKTRPLLTSRSSQQETGGFPEAVAFLNLSIPEQVLQVHTLYITFLVFPSLTAPYLFTIDDLMLRNLSAFSINLMRDELSTHR